MCLLIKDVLKYSSISGANQQVVPVDLNEVMRNILADFELLLAEKEASVHYEILPAVQGIPMQLYQLLANLMSNALKFSRGKAVISITVRQRPQEQAAEIPQLDAGRTYHEIVFRDNGIGFEQQHAEKIFGIFQRLENRGAYSGTGIGLALCKRSWKAMKDTSPPRASRARALHFLFICRKEADGFDP